MANAFKFELVSPESLLLSGDAEIVTVPGAEGDMGILANHAPLMTSLRPGMVSAKLADGSEEAYFVRGGFADIAGESVTVLAEFAVAKKDLTKEVFAEQLRLAKEDAERHEASGDDEKITSSRAYLDQLTHLESTLTTA